MAVHSDPPGIEVEVCVQDIPLQEFEEKEEAEDNDAHSEGDKKTIVVSRYIMSIADQDFTVRIVVRDPSEIDCPILAFVLSVDGKTIASKTMQMVYFGSGEKIERSFLGALGVDKDTKQGILRPFHFSKVNISHEDNAYSRIDRDIKDMVQVGCINVEVWRCRAGPIRVPKFPTLVHENIEVHEKALKGEPKYHSTSLGNARPYTLPQSGITAVKLDAHPLARFTFKYRSEVALKELLVIERTPEPEDSPEPEVPEPLDLDSLDAEGKRKMEELFRTLKSSSGHGPKIKREHTDEDDGPSQSKKPRKSREKITIDLTDD